MQVIVILLLSGIFLSGMAYYIFHFDAVAEMNKIVLCPFRIITELPCPGCGMSRAFLSIGQLKIIQAVNYNLFSPFLFAIMVLYLFPKYYDAVIKFMVRYNLQWVLLLAVIVNWGIRIFAE
jgi:hypothetical protein